MAKFSTKGMDELANAISKAKDIPSSTVKDILQAMADELKDKVRTSADRFAGTAGAGFLDAMTIKLKAKEAVLTFKGKRSDSRHRGTREGEIAFLNEFGVPSKHMEARPFMQTAIDEYGDECVQKGEKVFNDWLESIGL